MAKPKLPAGKKRTSPKAKMDEANTKVAELQGLLEEVWDITHELSDYFQLETGDWPMISLYSSGEYVSGIIDDELKDILDRLRELRELNK